MKQIKDTVGLFSKTVDTFKASEKPSTSNTKGWFASKIEHLTNEYKRIRAELKDLRGTNYRLGINHYNIGNAKDARTRFKLLKYFAKDIKDLDYYIGRTYFEEGDFKQARQYLNAYLASGDTKFVEESNYTIHRMDEALDKIKQVPKTLVAHYYNLLSDYYNEIFIDDRAICPQKTLFEMLNNSLVNIGAPFGHAVLDLGCGTGFVGKLLKSAKMAAYIDGVDISEKMIEKSKAQKVDDIGVYNDLQLGDAIEYLTNTKKEYSIIIASNFIGHYTNPEEFLKLVHTKLKANGVLALTFKVYDGEEKMMFNQASEDFHYNGKYLMGLVVNDNWNLLLSMPISFVEQEDTGLIILQKK